jgi:simple sugar transport system permease protein
MQNISAFVSNNRRFIPLVATAALGFVAYAFGATFYPGMRDPQVFLNLFRANHYLLISAVGMTFVMLTGGIDLSVSGVVALTTVAIAALIREGVDPWVAMLLMLAMGMALGAIMGFFITYLKVQPFIATLAGMWFARGMCFFMSDDAIAIDTRVYRLLGGTKLLIPGLSDPVAKTGSFISILAVIAFLVLIIAMYVAHYTRFGRTIYAIGVNEGRNEISARLMGLPVNRTKMLVYMFSGFCSALAGIVLSIYVSSGHGLYAQSFEMDVIASVVMGGTMLTGGSGYVFGTLLGVIIFGITQTLIQFNGQLSSWWTRIVIGLLTLLFIGVQSVLAAQKGGRRGAKTGAAASSAALRNRRMLMYGGGAAAVVVVAVPIMMGLQMANSGEGANTPVDMSCQLQAFRREQADALLRDGAIITYERNGGPNCVDELYAIYPSGRIVGDDGTNKIEKQATAADVETLVSGIVARRWFTDEMYDTWHTPCGQCYGYYLTVYYKGETKTIKAVDGGTDAPADYWQVVALINGVIPSFNAE